MHNLGKRNPNTPLRHVFEASFPQDQSQPSIWILRICRDDTPYAELSSADAFCEHDNDDSSDSITDFATT